MTRRIGRNAATARLRRSVGNERRPEAADVADVVGEQIRQIIEGNGWQFRYPVGLHAPRVFKWRASVTDEEWIRLFAGADANFAAA